MKNIAVSDVRTFAIMGHTGSGKTALTDALLFKLGVNDRLGSTDNGSSMADWTDSEKNRKITLLAKPFNAAFKSRDGRQALMVFCDTPGYMDFYGQTIAASSVCESGLIVVDASAGIKLGTNKAWHRANELDLPRAIVITGIDKDNADFTGVVNSFKKTWNAPCVPVVMPSSDGKGVVDVLDGKDIPADMASAVKEIKHHLVELAAESNDALLEKYLGGEELSADEVAAGLRSAVNARKLVPVFACMPLKDTGLTELLEGILRLMPSPADRKYKDAEGNEINPAPDAPFCGFVWRTLNDSFVGQLTFVKICGGTLKSDSEVINASDGQKERIAGLLVTNGKQQTTVGEASAGEIVALTKLKHTKLNHTLCAAGSKALLKPLEFPNTLISYAVRGKSRTDEDKIGVAVARLAEEDPTIKVDRNTETHELLIAGMGDVHLEVAVEQMKNRSNVEVLLSTPKVPYRETVTGRADGHHKHKKQTGGHGQYGEVYLRVEPKRPDDEEWFVDDIVGGAIPGNFIPAVEKGLVDGLARGALAGYPVTDVKITLYDGTFHEVDSSEIAFKIAASKAFKDATTKAKPVLLEPIMTIKVFVPDRFMGDVSGALSHKRGRILGVGMEEGMQVITAEAPQAELFRYCAELRSMTAGEGTFSMSFARYDVVPSNIAQKVIESAEKEKEED